ncbi:MAG: AAA family ATPase [Fimbriimonadaceae bacterium]
MEETGDPTEWAFVDLADSALSGPKIEWLVDGMLPLKYLAVIGGDSKSGKSWFITAMALAIATGQPFMGMATVKRPVLWLAFEENETERHLAFDAYFGLGGATPERMHFLTSYGRLYIDDPMGLQQIGDAAARCGAGLVVVDPLHAAYSAGSIAEGSTARRVLSGVKQLCREMDLSTVIIHHLTKQTGSGMVRERMADSAQILAAASMDWLMEVERDSGPGDADVEEGDQTVGQVVDEDCFEENGVKYRHLDVDGWPKAEEERDQAVSAQVGGQASGQGESGRLIRLMGRGRGAEVNRNWLIHSRRPMEYRLIGSGDIPLRSPLERRALVALSYDDLNSRELSESLGAPIGSVRNMLTWMIGAGKVRVKWLDGRERVYSAR